MQEQLGDCLCKAEAVACVTSAQNFLDFKSHIIQSYLWALTDLVTKAKELNDEARGSFMKNGRELGLRLALLYVLKRYVKYYKKLRDSVLIH